MYCRSWVKIEIIRKGGDILTRHKKVVPILLAFLCMGFGDAVGPFVGLAKTEFELSNFLAMIIPFMGFIMFGILSVPMGIFQDKYNKKISLFKKIQIIFINMSG